MTHLKQVRDVKTEPPQAAVDDALAESFWTCPGLVDGLRVGFSTLLRGVLGGGAPQPVRLEFALLLRLLSYLGLRNGRAGQPLCVISRRLRLSFELHRAQVAQS